jgi:hypothetical protein
MTARDTYNASVQTAQTNLNFAGAAGNAAAAPNFGNNVLQFPSLAALKAAYALGQITYAQFISYSLASEMNAQVAVRNAKDVLYNAGDSAPA